MKFTSIFFTASVSIFAIHRKYAQKASEKYEVYFNIFHSERPYIRDLSQIYAKASEKYEVCINIFHNERQYIRDLSQICPKSERNI